MFDLTPYLLKSGMVHSFAWPGGYPLYYLCADAGILCPECVNKERELINAAMADPGSDKQWELIGADVNWEDEYLTCDHCNRPIESAYGKE